MFLIGPWDAVALPQIIIFWKALYFTALEIFNITTSRFVNKSNSSMK